MQGYQKKRFFILFPFIESDLRDRHSIITKMTLKFERFDIPSPISKSDRRIGTISRYVAPLTPIYLLNGGDRRWNIRPPSPELVRFVFSLLFLFFSSSNLITLFFRFFFFFLFEYGSSPLIF
ncbi:hypothetical protein GQ457_02G029150 [Hibiscus cannabinus]